MDVSVAITPQPSQQQLAAVERSKPLKCTGRIKVAVEAMVWLGMKRAAAAQHAGLQEQSLYVALRRPHVKAHYLAELEVLRLSGRARRLHRLEEISEQSTNLNAAVNAIRTLDQPENDVSSARAGLAQFPGFVIHVSNAPVQQHVAEGVSAKHQAISTTYEAVVEPTHKPPHE